MKNYFIFTIIICSLALTGCIQKGAEKRVEEPKAGLANPASVNCEEKGGTLEIRENEAGQYGVCKFDDGSECEEWAFFRGECGKGDRLNPSLDPGASGQAISDEEASSIKNWQTYKYEKEGYNINIKFPETWWYKRDVVEAEEYGYDFYVIFGESFEKIDEKGPEKIRLVIMETEYEPWEVFPESSATKLLAEKDNKKYFLTTPNYRSTEYLDTLNIMAGTFKLIN